MPDEPSKFVGDDDEAMAFIKAASGTAFSADHPGSHPPHPGLVFNPQDHHYHKPGEPGTPASVPAPPEPDDGDDVDHANPFFDAATDPLLQDLPEGEAKQTLIGKLKSVSEGIAARLVNSSFLIHKLSGVLGSILDNPDDMKKFGYNPTLTAQTDRGATNDPMSAQLGISTHFVTGIAAKMLGKAITFAKRKLKGQTPEKAHQDWLSKNPQATATQFDAFAAMDRVDEAVEFLAPVFEQVNQACGLDPQNGIDRARIRAGVESLGRG